MPQKFQERLCPVCGGKDAEAFLNKGGLRLVRCASCSMVYANPVALEMATGDFYDGSGLEYLSKDKVESDYSETRFERELRLFRAFCSAGTVLDVGCSSGGFLYQLTRRHPGDYQALGADISSAPLEYAQKMGVPVVQGGFLEQEFTQPFDAVTFWAVLEHLMEPRQFLKKAALVLKPGGACFILVPNLESLAVRLLGSKYRYITSEHINYFTPKTLRAFAEAEFEIVAVRSMHFNPIVILKDFRSRGAEVPRQERFELLRKTTAYKRSRWMFPVQLAYKACERALGAVSLADNLAIVCRKRAAG